MALQSLSDRLVISLRCPEALLRNAEQALELIAVGLIGIVRAKALQRLAGFAGKQVAIGKGGMVDRVRALVEPELITRQTSNAGRIGNKPLQCAIRILSGLLPRLIALGEPAELIRVGLAELGQPLCGRLLLGIGISRGFLGSVGRRVA